MRLKYRFSIFGHTSSPFFSPTRPLPDYTGGLASSPAPQHLTTAQLTGNTVITCFYCFTSQPVVVIVTASPQWLKHNPTAFIPLNTCTYTLENRPTSRTSCGSVATVPRATHRFPFLFEENLKAARGKRAAARLVADRAGLPDRDKIITGSPPGDKVLLLSPSLALSFSLSLWLSFPLSRSLPLPESMSLSPLSLSALLRRKRCSLMLSARLDRGNVTWPQERSSVCVCVCEKEVSSRGWAGPRAAAAPWTARTHRPHETETQLPEVENKERTGGRSEWLNPWVTVTIAFTSLVVQGRAWGRQQFSELCSGRTKWKRKAVSIYKSLSLCFCFSAEQLRSHTFKEYTLHRCGQTQTHCSIQLSYTNHTLYNKKQPTVAFMNTWLVYYLSCFVVDLRALMCKQTSRWILKSIFTNLTPQNSENNA